MKVAIISLHPAPYRDAFLAKLTRTATFDVDVYNLFPEDVGHRFWNIRKPEYSTRFLNTTNAPSILTCKRLLSLFVFSKKYDFVLWPGYVNWCIKICIFVSALVGKKYGFVADTAEQRRLSLASRIIKNYFVRRAALISVVGSAGRRVFEQVFGVNASKIVEGAYSLDGRVIENAILENRAEVRREIREQLHIEDGATMFLMVANMIPSRCYPVTSAGFSDFSCKHPGCYFVMVGVGPELEKMKEFAKDNESFRVIPGCAFNYMLRLYAAADVYVHGGTEPASTALIIGAIAHLPLISSPAVGCYHDVVKDGISGFSVEDYRSTDNWRDTFSRAIEARDRWSEMGNAAREFSRKLDVDEVVLEFVKHLEVLRKEICA